MSDNMDKFNKVIGESAKWANKGMDILGKGMNNASKKAADNLNETSSKYARSNSSVHCPKCKSTNVAFMENKRKKFSVGKAIGGSLLVPGGALAGFIGKKGKKNHWHCNNCGKTFVR